MFSPLVFTLRPKILCYNVTDFLLTTSFVVLERSLHCSFRRRIVCVSWNATSCL